MDLTITGYISPGSVGIGFDVNGACAVIYINDQLSKLCLITHFLCNSDARFHGLVQIGNPKPFMTNLRTDVPLRYRCGSMTSQVPVRLSPKVNGLVS